MTMKKCEHMWYAYKAEVQVREICGEICVYMPIEKRKKKLIIQVKNLDDVKEE